MPLDFPPSPSVNQIYTSGSNTWTWDGTAWNATSSVSVFTGATGATGSVSSDYVSSLNGSTGTVGISAGTNITITPSGNTYTIAAASTSPAGSAGYIQYHSAAGFSGDDGLVYTSGNETLQIGSGAKPLLLYAVSAGGFVEVPGNAASIMTISAGTNLDGTVNIGNSAGIGIVTSGSAETVEVQGTVSFIDPTGVYTNTFPTGTGATGQVLTTQASGLMYWSTPGGGGISRSVSSISTNTSAGSAASTDYVYVCTAGLTLTMPTAVSNTNRYTVKSTTTSSVLLNTTSSQTIDGSTTYTISKQYLAIDLVSNGSNWSIV